MSVMTNSTSTAAQYKPTSTSRDTAAGIMESKTGGALSFQMGMREESLSDQLGGMKLSESLKTGGKMRIGPDLDGIQDIGPKGYSPNSEEALGFSAVSATGRQHTHVSEIKPDSVLRIGGLEAQAEDLCRAGIIGKDEQGRYIIPSQEGASEAGKKKRSW